MDIAIQAGGAALGYPGLGRVAGTAYRAYKRRREDPGPSTPGNVMSDMNPSGFGGVYHGKFSGPVKRPRKSSRIYKGFKEKIIFSGRSTQSKCWYMNLQSCPMPITDNTTSNVYPLSTSGQVEDRYIPRVLSDICIAIVREFYKKYHPGRIEFCSPDDKPRHYLTAVTTAGAQQGVNMTGGGALLGERLCYVYNNADGSGLSNAEIDIMNTTTDSLFTIGRRLAFLMWTKWKEGSTPYCLIAQTIDSDNHASSRGVMHLNQLIVTANVYNKVILQNITKGENNETTIVDINMDPLKGKMFYHKGLAPAVVVGNIINPSSVVTAEDEWFQDYMTFPTIDNVSGGDNIASTLGNLTFPVGQDGVGTAVDPVVSTVKVPTGCWVTVPKPEYFKRCTGVRDIALEPGVMRSFNLDFNFEGYLTTLMSKFQNEYAYNITKPWNTSNIGYKFPIGSCVTIALEKRMRFDPGEDVPITIAFQLETHITADIKSKRQGMTYNVSTNY